jgi:hypothetical protein
MAKRVKDPNRRCGLCGKTTRLTRTPCCNQWICDDEDDYVMFSYVRNSCYRNHRRYTLCGFHFGEEHEGRWQDCEKCRDEFETEIYVHFGTNEYNFEKLENPPEFEPTVCASCGVVLNLGEGGYSFGPNGYQCIECTWGKKTGKKATPKPGKPKTRRKSNVRRKP